MANDDIEIEKEKGKKKKPKWGFDKLDGAIVEDSNPFEQIINTDSPSVNFIFGKTHGLPRGYTVALYGPPRGGKSILCHMMAGKVHRDDPDAEVLKFDSEFRTKVQLTKKDMPTFGIDPSRFHVCEINTPSGIFDQISGKVAAMCEAGTPLKLIIIDSISSVQGRREMNAESVENQQIGDHALTIQMGLKRILPVIRKYNIALALVVQVRDELDQTERMRGNKFKMGASFGLKHMAEYFVCVEMDETKDGRKDLLGREFVNESFTDLADKGEQTAYKIKVKMKKSSLGPTGRTGKFTWSFKEGLVNVHEEVFLLGVNRNIITNEKQGTYEYNGQSWRGMGACLEALEKDPELCDSIIAELKRRDLAGEFNNIDRRLAETEDDLSGE